MIDFKDDVFIEINFTKESQHILSIDIHFNEFNKHRDKSLLEEGVNTFDTVIDDVNDDGVLVSGLFEVEGFLNNQF